MTKKQKYLKRPKQITNLKTYAQYFNKRTELLRDKVGNII